jgi:hypothetical protein
MHRADLFAEMLQQINKQSIDKFLHCAESNDIDSTTKIQLKRMLQPICVRLSLEPEELTNTELNRLARQEWLEICSEWIAYSSPILDQDSEQHYNAQPDRDCEYVGTLSYLHTEAVIFLLDEESQLLAAAIAATRQLAVIYRELHDGSLFSNRFDPQRF